MKRAIEERTSLQRRFAGAAALLVVIAALRDGRKVTTVEKSQSNVGELISLILGHEIRAELPQAVGVELDLQRAQAAGERAGV